MYVHILNIESMKPIKNCGGRNLGGGDGPPAPRPPDWRHWYAIGLYVLYFILTSFGFIFHSRAEINRFRFSAIIVTDSHRFQLNSIQNIICIALPYRMSITGRLAQFSIWNVRKNMLLWTDTFLILLWTSPSPSLGTVHHMNGHFICS